MIDTDQLKAALKAELQAHPFQPDTVASPRVLELAKALREERIALALEQIAQSLEKSAESLSSIDETLVCIEQNGIREGRVA